MASHTDDSALEHAPAPKIAALQHISWGKRLHESFRGTFSAIGWADRALSEAGFDRAPWLVIAFAGGIAGWFLLDTPGQWAALITLCAVVLTAALWANHYAPAKWPHLMAALSGAALMIATGCATVWMKSAMAGAPGIDKPVAGMFQGKVLERREMPAEGKVRLVMAIREPGSGKALRIRLNLPDKLDRPGLSEGARIRVQARLMPPAPPLIPGAYNFARTAWFAGISATGTALKPPVILMPGTPDGQIAAWRRTLSLHVRESLPGSAGALASAFSTGDRGAIALSDEEVMRDAGLTHLLSISGLHVSAVIAAVFFLSTRLLALWPWLVLRFRLPLLGAGLGASAGIAYTLFTGAEVPTIRSCIGAILVLIALALGREPLSMRMLATVGFIILLFWPEALVSPGFQMSFASVMTIVALSQCGPVRRFMVPREEGMLARGGRRLTMLMITGVAIELCLMPIGLYHFHSAGIYGALANVIAIPLTTLLSMPLIALALLADLGDLGAPLWWLAGKSLNLLLALAHWTAAQPGAKALLPTMENWQILTFIAGWLWLVLWQQRMRFLGLPLIAAAAASLALLEPPDLLITHDGRHVGIVPTPGAPMLMLRGEAGGYAYDSLMESAGQGNEAQQLADYPGARCSADFCALTLSRSGQDWHVLISRGKNPVPSRALAAACDLADIVVSDRFLPRSCQPRWIKADRNSLGQTGGIAIYLSDKTMRTVAQSEGKHGWWREGPRPLKN